MLAALVVGHIIKATSTLGSLEGIRRGTVTSRYAAEHHEKWRPSPPAPRAFTRAPLVMAAVVLAAAVAAVTLLV